jgi:hypothetical protein
MSCPDSPHREQVRAIDPPCGRLRGYVESCHSLPRPRRVRPQQAVVRCGLGGFNRSAHIPGAAVVWVVSWRAPSCRSGCAPGSASADPIRRSDRRRVSQNERGLGSLMVPLTAGRGHSVSVGRQSAEAHTPGEVRHGVRSVAHRRGSDRCYRRVDHASEEHALSRVRIPSSVPMSSAPTDSAREQVLRSAAADDIGVSCPWLAHGLPMAHGRLCGPGS